MWIRGLWGIGAIKLGNVLSGAGKEELERRRRSIKQEKSEKS